MDGEMDKLKQLQQGLSFEESDSGQSDSETQDVDDKSHARLLDAISTMDGSKRLTHTLRAVHGQSMSETGLASSVPAHTLMTDLMGSLEQSASFGAIKKQLESVFKPGTGAIETPAPKHVQEKIQRTVAYEKTVKDISRWEPVVTANRKAPQLRFPLQHVTPRMLDQQIRSRPVTDLEKEMKELDKKAKPENKIPKGKLYTPKEEREMAAMSLEEAKLRRAQLLSMRILIYNRNSKLHWQNKIKSKRYRRAKKKEKEKQAEKEMEELALRDPQALIDKMEESDRKRILERGRLRHAGGKKFAREARIFSKYDEDKRQQIQDMLMKHQDLKKKNDIVLSSSDSEDEDDSAEKLWMQPAVWPVPTSTDLPTTTEGTSTAQTSLLETVDATKEDSGEHMNSALENETSGPQSSVPESADVMREDSGDDANSEAENEIRVPEAVDVTIEDSGKDVSSKLENETSCVTEERKKKKKNKKKKDQTNSAEPLQQLVVDTPDSQKKVDKRLTQQGGFAEGGKQARGDNEEKTSQDFQEKRKKKKNRKKKGQKDDDSSLLKQQKIVIDTPDVQDDSEVVMTEQESFDDGRKHTKGDANTEIFLETKEGRMGKKNNKKTKDQTKESEKIVNNPEQKTDTQDRVKEVMMTIQEAFDDDDVVAQFVEDKQQVVDEEREKDIDTFVPGWGRWAGPDIKESAALRKRFIIKATPTPRKDNSIGHVVFTTKENTGIKKHRLKKLPHMYKSVEHMKKVLTRPLNRETTKPKVVVARSGQVIQPIQESVLLQGPKKRAADINIDRAKKDNAKPQKRRRRR